MRAEPLLLLLLAGPARAWEHTGTSWAWQSHPLEDPFWLDDGTFPAEVDAGELGDAIDLAMLSWTELGLDLSLARGGEVADGVLDPDGRFTILHEAYSGMGGALAFAGAWTWDADGAAFDCDVVFLDYNDYGEIVWDASPDGPASGTYDVRAVALHELGHCLGLGHSADSSAVMYAYYYGLRELTGDDEAGVEALYATGCVDGDGDGFSDCDGDCDDDNALVSPGAEEVCDGLDGNCNEAVDEAEEALVSLTKDRAIEEATGWVSAGNAFHVDAPTTLRAFRQQMTVSEGARLVWTVYRSDDGGSSWSLARELRAEGTAEAWQQSPDLDLALEAGAIYEAALGVLGEQTIGYHRRPDLEPQGPVTPLGAVVSRGLGDQPGEVDDAWLMNQELEFTAAADADGDGETALCGDCAPEDGATWSGAAELCDGLDQDCDGEVDEGFPDTDADGALDCLDPCPEDALDDQDGDGLCADADPCPEDPLDACDDPPPADTADSAEPELPAETGEEPVEEEEPEAKQTGGCGCAAGGRGSAPGLLAPLALLGLLRRRRAHSR